MKPKDKPSKQKLLLRYSMVSESFTIASKDGFSLISFEQAEKLATPEAQNSGQYAYDPYFFIVLSEIKRNRLINAAQIRVEKLYDAMCLLNECSARAQSAFDELKLTVSELANNLKSN